MYGFRYEELFHSSIWYSHSRTLDAMSNSSGGWDFSWSIENLTGDVIMNLVPTNRPQHSRSFEWHRAIPKFDPEVSVVSRTLQVLNLPWLLQLLVSVRSSRHRWEGVSELERTATRTESDKIFVPLAACLIFIRSITLQPIVRDWMHSSGERLLLHRLAIAVGNESYLLDSVGDPSNRMTYSMPRNIWKGIYSSTLQQGLMWLHRGADVNAIDSSDGMVKTLKMSSPLLCELSNTHRPLYTKQSVWDDLNVTMCRVLLLLRGACSCCSYLGISGSRWSPGLVREERLMFSLMWRMPT